jgi:hypothetical protein
LHGWRLALRGSVLAAVTALACQGCPTAAPPIDSEPDLGPPGPEPCRLGAPSELPDSVGAGPVRLAPSGAGFVALYQGGGVPDGALRQLHVVELDGVGRPVGLVRAVDSRHEGSLEAEAIGVYEGGVAVAGRDAAGRRPYFFHAAGAEAFRALAYDAGAVLDRRTSVALVTPAAGAGLQLAVQVSGEPRVTVGHLAGGLFATDEVELPTPGAPPSIAPSRADELALLTVEADEAAGWRVVLRELAAGGTVVEERVLASLPDDHRVEWTHLAATDGGYRAFWSHWRRGQFGVDVAEVPGSEPDPAEPPADEDDTAAPPEGSGGHGAAPAPVAVHRLFRAEPGAVVRAADVASTGREIVLVWEQAVGGASTLSAATFDMAGGELHRESLRSASRGTIADLTLVAHDSDGYLLAWRDRAEGSLEGPVRATELTCADAADATTPARRGGGGGGER